MFTDQLRTVATVADEAGLTFREVYDSVPAMLPYELPPTVRGTIDALSNLEILPDALRLPGAAVLEARLRAGITGPLSSIQDRARPLITRLEKLNGLFSSTANRSADLIEVTTKQGQEVLKSLDWLIG